MRANHDPSHQAEIPYRRGGYYALENRNRSVQICGSLAIMRLFVAAFITLLSLALSGFASINFNGTWVLDLKASDSPEPMMKRMGVSVFERKLAASTKLEASYSQSGDLLTITTRGPAFSRTEHLRLDGHPETKIEKRTGAYTIRTSWAHHGKELISTSTFLTKNGRNAELIVARKLAALGPIGTPPRAVKSNPVCGKRSGDATPYGGILEYLDRQLFTGTAAIAETKYGRTVTVSVRPSAKFKSLVSSRFALCRSLEG